MFFDKNDFTKQFILLFSFASFLFDKQVATETDFAGKTACTVVKPKSPCL